MYEARISHALSAQRIRRLEHRLCHSFIRSLPPKARKQPDILGLKLIWHMCFILLSTDPKSLSTELTGHTSESDEGTRAYVREWSTSSAGRRSVLHAVGIKQIVAEWPIAQQRPSHFPHAAYLAGLCICCFIRFGTFEIADLMQSNIEQLEYPELRMDEMDVASAILELNLAAPDGRPAPIAYNTSFQELLTVLESDRNSHMSLGFAKRLQSAVDRERVQILPDAPLLSNTSPNSYLPGSNYLRTYSKEPPVNFSDNVTNRVSRQRKHSEATKLIGKKRRRSQIEEHLEGSGKHPRTSSSYPSATSKKQNPDQCRSKGDENFHPDFPSCYRCFTNS